LGLEGIALRLELISQFVEIINFAIEAKNVAIISVNHRLMAAGTEIYNAEPIVADREASGHVNEPSSIVWPAMSHRSHHAIKRRLIEPCPRIYQPTAYRAHSVGPFAQRLLKPCRSNLGLLKL
jgi:hypothetical protein